MAQNQEQGIPRCQYCNRPLRSQEAIKNGYGQECLRKHQAQVANSPEFASFLSNHGVSVDTFKELETTNKEKAQDIHQLYDEHLRKLENPLPTYKEFFLANGVTESEYEMYYGKNQEALTDGKQYDINNPEDRKRFEREDLDRKIFQLSSRYRREVITTEATKYTPIYQTNSDRPTTVDYSFLNNEYVEIEYAEYDGQAKELRVYSEVRPDENQVPHPSFYEVVTFKKGTNGETVAVVETIGVQVGDLRKEIRNPQYDPNHPYQQHLAQIKEDYEAQAGATPEIQPAPHDLESVFQHGYNCDYPLIKDKYKAYGVDLQGVRYYDPKDISHEWSSGVMVMELHDQKDGNVQIRYDVDAKGGIVTTITQSDKVMRFPEGSTEWAFHPTHIKYYELFKETQRDYKITNQQQIQYWLEHRLREQHSSLQAVERAIATNENRGYEINSKEVLKQQYETEITKLTIQLDALKEKKDPNIEQLRQVIREEEAIKVRLFQERFVWNNQQLQQGNKDYYGDNHSFKDKAFGYFAKKFTKRLMKQHGLLPE